MSEPCEQFIERLRRELLAYESGGPRAAYMDKKGDTRWRETPLRNKMPIDRLDLHRLIEEAEKGMVG